MISNEYLAGFFDGEGCINITVRGKNNQVTLRLMLVNTNYELLAEIQEFHGGFLTRRERGIKAHWKALCCLTWAGGNAVNLLHNLRPHLRLKRKQAELAIEFVNFMHSPGRLVTFSGKTGGQIRTSQTLARELEFKNMMHALNKKGVA